MRTRDARRNLSVLLIPCLAGLFAASCAPVEPAPRLDYIGPAHAPAERAETPPSAAVRPGEPLALTLSEAVLMSLENNRALRVQRLGPPIRRTGEDRARAAFDPVASGALSADRTRAEQPARVGPGSERSVAEGAAGAVSVDAFLPTGTTVGVEGAGGELDSSASSDRAGSLRVGLTVTQALLRGFGPETNLADLRQARLDTRASEFELRGFAESLVGAVETTYRDCALAERRIRIFQDSLGLAERQLSETQERIAVGRLAETELAAAQAEVALRREGLINARSSLATVRLRLLRLVNPPDGDLARGEVVLQDHPSAPEEEPDDVEDHVAMAMRMRPDLNEARLRIERGDLEIVKTRNGLLPRLDLFIALGKSGYADSFGSAVSDLDERSYDAAAGIVFAYPIGNRDARARHQRATLERRQAAEALENAAQLAEVDVRSAFIEVRRSIEQVAATAATRAFQEEKLRAETEKFRVGKSTSLWVAQAQRDLVASQIAEIEAVINYRRATVDMFRLEGSLLERRGISAPGRSLNGDVGRPVQ